jgi:hypothetical protein
MPAPQFVSARIRAGPQCHNVAQVETHRLRGLETDRPFLGETHNGVEFAVEGTVLTAAVTGAHKRECSYVLCAVRIRK